MHFGCRERFYRFAAPVFLQKIYGSLIDNRSVSCYNEIRSREVEINTETPVFFKRVAPVWEAGKSREMNQMPVFEAVFSPFTLFTPYSCAKRRVFRVLFAIS